MFSSWVLGIEQLYVYGDSQLIVKQLKNEYKVKKKELFGYYKAAYDISKQFKTIEFNFIPRESNQAADKLASSGIAMYYKKKKEE